MTEPHMRGLGVGRVEGRRGERRRQGLREDHALYVIKRRGVGEDNGEREKGEGNQNEGEGRIGGGMAASRRGRPAGEGIMQGA